LKFPLAFRHFGVNAFDVDSGIKTQVNVLLDDLASYVADVLEADAGVILTLRERETFIREAKRLAVFVEKIFLLETEPRAGVVQDGCAAVARMRRLAVRHHDFAHHQHAVLAGAVRKNCNGFQHAIGALAFRLPRGAAVEAPQGKLFEFREALVFDNFGFASEIGNGFVAVEPDVFEFVLCHFGCL
jgi:hypothetical protein